MAQPRYQVIERIDAGGMAEVFKANSTSLQGFEKLVAIKRILPNLTQNERFVRMFLDEAKVSLHLNHTNCVQVFDLGIADGTYFIVMEFVDGTNLKKLIEFIARQGQGISVAQAVHMAIEICKGLTHAHEKVDQSGRPLGIVHRDISPPNVLISRAGEVKITDFGLAKAKSQAEITDPGVVKGKFGYLSPEAAHGEEVDARTDIFAVGILLWEMLAGRRLFLGESDYGTLQLVRKAQIPSIRKLRPDVPAELEAVLARALERDPARRIQSAEELGRQLATFLFAHGQVVTSYDLSDLVSAVIEKRPKRARTVQDMAVDMAIQQQLNQLKSLEEIQDLDLYLTQHYDSLPDQGEASQPGSGTGEFEDPRMWADLGFGNETSVGEVAAPPEQPSSGESGSWQEAGLADLGRSTSALQAIKGPGTAASRKPHSQGRPPTLPGSARAPQASPADAVVQPGQPGPMPSSQPAPPAPMEPQPPAHRPGAAPASGGVGKTALIVALLVVLLGAGAAYFLGLIPPG
ncbi:serine/threonine-protein kinase [Lujinxingia litoralis]|nr:serine/threonine-protein kinase [Lujinxingia litoralis]